MSERSKQLERSEARRDANMLTNGVRSGDIGPGANRSSVRILGFG